MKQALFVSLTSVRRNNSQKQPKAISSFKPATQNVKPASLHAQIHPEFFQSASKSNGNSGSRRGGGRNRGGGGGGRGGGWHEDDGDDNNSGRYLCAGAAVASEVIGATRREYYEDGDGCYRVKELQSNTNHRKIVEQVRLFFLPDGFPESVGDSYLEYSFWRGLQNVISSMTAVLSTQALLTAVGVGGGQAAGWAAATNWILKDGFGTLGKIVTARMGQSFDCDAKLYRLLSDVVFDAGLSLELVTPLFPQYFMLLAGVGNFLKSVSITIGMACRNSVLTTFSKRENFGDICSKNDAQNTITNLFGMVLGIGTARVLPSKPVVRLSAFMVLTGIYSVFNYFSMRAVELSTLNRQRAALALDRYIQGLGIPHPRYSNEHERIVPGKRPRFSDPKLVFGASLESLQGDMIHLVKKNRNERYILHMTPDAVNVVLRKDCTTKDLLEVMLGYCYLRKCLQNRLRDGHCKMASTFSEKKMKCIPTIERVYKEIDDKTRCELAKKSRKYAKRNVGNVIRGLDEAGYNTRTLLFALDKPRAEW